MTIVCLGDSITWGFPWGPDFSWVKLAAETTGVSLVNKGVNGDTTEDLIRRFNGDVAALKPSHLIMMAGTNDACLSMPLKQYAANCHALVEKAESHRITPALGLPIPADDSFIEGRLAEYRRWIVDYCEANRIAVLDFGPVSLLDDVHPDREGYLQMAEAAAIFIKKWLEKC
ncbi:MAG: GDSL-type esterase/lipase family protein [Bacillota bacterium]